MNSMTQRDSGKGAMAAPRKRTPARSELHPSWRAFIRYCAELQHGEIASLKIQDGLPVLAERIRAKVKFTG